jgi:hypothetical protein
VSHPSPPAAAAGHDLKQQQEGKREQQQQEQGHLQQGIDALEPPPPQHQQEEEPEEHEQLPESFSMPPDELLYSVQWALTSELHKTRKLTPEQVISATEVITESFRGALQARAGSTAFPGGAAGDAPGASAAAVGGEDEGVRGSQQAPALLAPTTYTVLPYQLAKLKKALVEKRDK